MLPNNREKRLMRNNVPSMVYGTFFPEVRVNTFERSNIAKINETPNERSSAPPRQPRGQ
jgi:hypothetical protein